MNHTRKNGVPSRNSTSNPEFRTLLLCALSYGDKRSKPLAGLFHRLTPSAFQNPKDNERVSRSIYFVFRDLKWYACPVTLRIPALI